MLLAVSFCFLENIKHLVMENIVEHFNGEDEQKKNNGELSKILACSLMY